MSRPLRFGPALLRRRPALSAGDGVLLLALAALVYVLARVAFAAPRVVRGPEISLAPAALPWYAFLSVGRMAAAYVLSLVFSLAYGYAAARNRSARTVLMPLLDILQSVPILSFLPVVLLSFSAVMPQWAAAEVASVVLIFTSQAWNMTFSFYQSMTTVPLELREAAAMFRFDPWLRFRTLELPFAAVGLIWNSMMSWSGGWFFLMAAEIFNVGARDFRLPGLGSYLQTAAVAGDARALALGLLTLVLIIALLDQCVWRPILAWAERFKIEMVGGDAAPRPWFLDLVHHSRLMRYARTALWRPALERVDARWRGWFRRGPAPVEAQADGAGTPWTARAIALAVGALGLAGVVPLALFLRPLDGAAWTGIGAGLAATFGRVAVALAIALVWTVPVGVLIGTNRRAALVLQPLVQIFAAIPATALFPVLVLALIGLPGGLDIAAVSLMLMGTQWYLLFNVIAGAAAIPQDLRDTTDLLRLSRFDRWRTLILPAIFPYVITGAITASGGAWNASIVAEYIQFGNRTLEAPGVGALIARATAHGDYPLLVAATLALVLAVVLVNRTFWMRLYRRAEQRFSFN